MKSSAALIFAAFVFPSEIYAPSSTTTVAVVMKQIYSFTLNKMKFTCNVDSNGHPFQDCLNSIAYSTNFSAGQSIYLTNLFFNNSAVPWSNFRNNCMPGRIGVTERFSAACNNSGQYLMNNGYIYGSYSTKLNVSRIIVDNLVKFLWTSFGVNASIVHGSFWPDPNLVIKGVSAPLVKRSLVFGTSLGSYFYPCNRDINDNPYQDCLNMLAVWCAYDANTCKSAVDLTFSTFNTYWRLYLQSCASWKNSNNYEQANSETCKKQTTYFLGNVTTIADSPEFSKPINEGFTSSIYQRLLNNQTILRSRMDAWSLKYSIRQYGSLITNKSL